MPPRVTRRRRTPGIPAPPTERASTEVIPATLVPRWTGAWSTIPSRRTSSMRRQATRTTRVPGSAPAEEPQRRPERDDGIAGEQEHGSRDPGRPRALVDHGPQRVVEGGQGERTQDGLQG